MRRRYVSASTYHHHHHATSLTPLQKPEALPKVLPAVKPVEAPKVATPVVKPVEAPKPTTPAAAIKPAAPEPPKPVVATVHEERKCHHPSTCSKHLPCPYRSETQRLQWEMTERALAKNDDGLFKKWGKHVHGLKDK